MARNQSHHCLHDGPEYFLDGRYPLYTQAALDKFAAARLRGPFRSTSERIVKTDKSNGELADTGSTQPEPPSRALSRGR
jgi:hypothetical protein